MAWPFQVCMSLHNSVSCVGATWSFLSGQGQKHLKYLNSTEWCPENEERESDWQPREDEGGKQSQTDEQTREKESKMERCIPKNPHNIMPTPHHHHHLR